MRALNPVYRSEHDQLNNELKVSYAIFSQQRTGSTWLCNALTNYRYFGLPAEYLNVRARNDLMSRLFVDKTKKIGLKNYISKLWQIRTSEAGYFGIKIQPGHLNEIFHKHDVQKINFLNSFDRMIIMRRSDKLNQAISTTIAQMTDQWWTTDGDLPEIKLDNKRKIAYSVGLNLSREIAEDIFMQNIISKINIPIFEIEYSQIQKNPKKILKDTVNFLGYDAKKMGRLDSDNILPEIVKAKDNDATKIKNIFCEYIGL